MSHSSFIRKRRQLLIDNHRSKLQEKHSKLLSHSLNGLVACDDDLVDYLLHSFSCLDMHNRLQMPKSIDDPLSYLLNLLPPTFLTKKTRKSIDAWLISWPSICAILLEMDYLAHLQVPETSNYLGEPFVKRLRYIQQKFSDS
ncbi:uncharacterized protein RHIMIDRAFT_238240 [Rhizopus microsporus ATCC 52813]|uniref:Uncharacterized protein n=1 Tax=Rhizopus microsporus ATCC 52813 TaxID=1340429 RepID=A0A2G4SS32_RHIZD|nr:uncharacterized protein RHIMIDRAFT_238240 [Rhizopus microsporus ATCC 52813]PHZ11571.1 hypothetical protein RHIMIDRAFT_238240 [Rhizopus microsporus ATCC 52813]